MDHVRASDIGAALDAAMAAQRGIRTPASPMYQSSPWMIEAARMMPRRNVVVPADRVAEGAGALAPGIAGDRRRAPRGTSPAGSRSRAPPSRRIACGSGGAGSGRRSSDPAASGRKAAHDPTSCAPPGELLGGVLIVFGERSRHHLALVCPGVRGVVAGVVHVENRRNRQLLLVDVTVLEWWRCWCRRARSRGTKGR